MIQEKLMSRDKRMLKGLIGLNIIIYVALLIPLALNSYTSVAVCSLPLVALFNIVDFVALNNELFNWPCIVIIRIVIILHDFAYFVTYAVYYANHYHYYRCTLATSICFSFTFALGIAILFAYSRLQRNSSWSYCPVVIQPSYMPIPVLTDQPPSYANVQ